MKKHFFKNQKFRNFTIKLAAGAMLFQSTLSFAQPLIEKELLNTFLKRDNYNNYEGDYGMGNQHSTIESKIDILMNFFENQNFIRNNDALKKDIKTALENTSESLEIEAQRIVYTLLQTQINPGSRFNAIHKETRTIKTNKIQEEFLRTYHTSIIIQGKKKEFDAQQKDNIIQIDKLYDQFFDRGFVTHEKLTGIVPSKTEPSLVTNMPIIDILNSALEGKVSLDAIISGYDFGDGTLSNVSFNASKTAGIIGSSYENIQGKTYEQINKTEISIEDKIYLVNIGNPNQTTFDFEDYLKQFRNGIVFDLIRYADIYYGTNMIKYEITKNEQGELTLDLRINNENKDLFFNQFTKDSNFRRWMIGMNTLHPLIVESLEDLRITTDVDWRNPTTEMIDIVTKGFINLPNILIALELKNTFGESNSRLQELYVLANKENLTLQDIYKLSFMDNNLKTAIQSYYNNPNIVSYSSIPNYLQEQYKLAFILCGLTYGVSNRYGDHKISSTEFNEIMTKEGKMGDFIKYPIKNHINAYINAEKLLGELEKFADSKGWTMEKMRNLVLEGKEESREILDKMTDLAWIYIVRSSEDINKQLNPNITKRDIRNSLENMKDERMFFLMYTAAGGRLGLNYSLICTWKEWDFWTKPEGQKLKNSLESLGANGFYVPEFDFDKLTQGVTKLQLSVGKSNVILDKREGVITGDLTTLKEENLVTVQLLFQRRQTRDGRQTLIIDDLTDNSFNLQFNTQIFYGGTFFSTDKNNKLNENKIKDEEAKNSWIYLYVVNSEGKIVSCEITKAGEDGKIDYTLDARNIGEVPEEGSSTEYKIYALPFEHEYIRLMEPADNPTLVGKIIIGSREKITEMPEVNMPSEIQNVLVAFTVPQLETGADLNSYQETANYLKEGLENITIVANLSTYDQFGGTIAYNNLKTNFIANIEEYLRPLIKDIDRSDPYTDYEGMLDEVLTDLTANRITIDEAYKLLFGRDPISGDPVSEGRFEIISGAMVGKARSRVNIRVVPSYTYGAMFSTKTIKSLYSENGINFYSFKAGFETTEYAAEILGESGEIIVTRDDIKEITNFSEKALTTRAIAEMGFHIVPLKTILTLKALREEILSDLDLESILNNEKEIEKKIRYGIGAVVQPLTKSESIFGKLLDKTAIYGGVKFYDEKNIERLYGGGMILINPIKNNNNIKIGIGTHLEYTTPEGVLAGGGYLTMSPNMNLNIDVPIGKNWGIGADASALAVYNREEINQRHILGLGATGTLGVSITRKINIGRESFEIRLRGEFKNSIIKEEDPINQWGIGIEILR
ncbi:hypothetical protein KO317_01335 [Candidatus Micrarchaeota archaeon]|nr:hypothetical protein [Candidatus Micrarchaeota archaeon]